MVKLFKSQKFLYKQKLSSGFMSNKMKTPIEVLQRPDKAVGQVYLNVRFKSLYFQPKVIVIVIKNCYGYQQLNIIEELLKII